MKQGWLIAVGLVFGMASAPVCAADGPLKNEHIVELTEAGLGPVVIVSMIESSPTAFDTSVGAVIALTKKGVNDVVIASMVAAGQGPATRGGFGGGYRGGGGSGGGNSGGGSSGGGYWGGRAAPPADSASALGSPAQPATGQTARTQPKAIPGSTFRESLRSGGEGPEMVVIPAGSFRIGCLSNDDACLSIEKPVHQVAIAQAFAVSKYEVTFEDYDRFTYPNMVDDEGWGRGRRPVINVDWNDAWEYVEWLSSETGAQYRLLSEAEWEYAARAGSTTKFSWSDEIGTNWANCDGCGSQWDDKQTAPVGSFAPNAFGLHDLHGNVWEWVEDCWNNSHAGAPSDGSASTSGWCHQRVLRGGAWRHGPEYLRASFRDFEIGTVRNNDLGFRVARTLTP